MDFVEAIQLIALRDVLMSTQDYRIRRLQRWYSREFCTPLRDVEANVTIAELLQHWFEEHFEQLEEDKQKEVKALALESEQQRQLRQRQEDAQAADEENFHKMLEAEAAAASVKKEDILAVKRQRPEAIIPEAKLPDLSVLPSDSGQTIEMKFITKEELERQLQDLGSIPLPDDQD